MRRPILSQMQTFFTPEGLKVRAEMGAVTDSAQANYMPARQFTVAKPAHVKAGSVVNGLGTTFILADHAELLKMITFIALEATDFLDHFTPSRVIDPVTGLPRGEGAPVLKQPVVPVSLQPQPFGTEMNVEVRNITLISPVPAAPGDLFGEYVVQTVSPFRGIWEMEVS